MCAILDPNHFRYSVVALLGADKTENGQKNTVLQAEQGVWHQLYMSNMRKMGKQIYLIDR